MIKTRTIERIGFMILQYGEGWAIAERIWDGQGRAVSIVEVGFGTEAAAERHFRRKYAGQVGPSGLRYMKPVVQTMLQR